jgi:cell wall-associated NlpC family hydrolase
MIDKSNKLDIKIVSYLFVRCILLTANILFSACTSVPESSLTDNYSSSVNYALTLQGKPYQYGKDSPEEGFDCSGFVKHVYEHQGVSLPRTAEGMAMALTPAPKNDLRSGDLIFFSTNGKPYSHVGIYINNDDFIHAPSHSSGKVQISSLKNRYWGERFSCARRP